ncbi:hypothetical protein [Chromobacterium violaceum]|uniref:hypothetical protein n=1 Tax=Chromobacterium violaceum TaxID=536 RepID=UPI001C8B7429|nr:hypothetical protein [Chromobacterium violaceum]MBX9267786.1 hypothetical protein [Chromobacterium violaceum]
MSLYAELVRHAADQYRSQLDALYARQYAIQQAERVAGLLNRAGLPARALADEQFMPYVELPLAEELQAMRQAVLSYVCNVLECRLEGGAIAGGDRCYRILPDGAQGQGAGLLLLVTGP